MFEFELMVEGYNNRQVDKYNNLIYLAWHVEAFTRTKKLPELKKLLKKSNNNVELDNNKFIDMAKQKGLNGFWNK